MRRAEIDEWHLAAQAPEAPDDYAETLAEKLRQNELLAAQDPREPWSCDAHDHPSPRAKHAAAAKLALGGDSEAPAGAGRLRRWTQEQDAGGTLVCHNKDHCDWTQGQGWNTISITNRRSWTMLRLVVCLYR